MAVSMIDYISDWAARLRSRLYTQFRGKTTWGQWVDLLAQQFQDLEDAAQTLASVLDIDNSVGVQLDVIGKIVGQPRLGYDDATYQGLLRARVLANRSTGTPEEIYAIFRALFDLSLAYELGGYKEFALRITAPATAAQAAIGVVFLLDGKEAGARGILRWQEYESALMFAFTGATGLGFDAGRLAGAEEA